jgi:phage shock protein C
MSTAAAEIQTATFEREPPLPLRGDTFLGVCEAIGQDLGFNPNWLRIPFAALILWNPVAIVGLYLGLGVVVAAARWYFPAEQKQQAAQPQAVATEAAAANGKELETEELLAA